MTDDTETTVRYRLTGFPELRTRFYRAIARELAATPYPAAVLVEASTARATIEVTLAPAGVFGSVLAAPAFSSIQAATASRGAGPTGRGATFAWALGPATNPAASFPGGLWDVPEHRALLGEHGVLESRTFWLSGRRDGRLWASRRVRFTADDATDLDRRAAPVGAYAAVDWSRATGTLCQPKPIRQTDGSFESADPRTIPRSAWLALPVGVAGQAAEPVGPETSGAPPTEDGHSVILGSSGAGKTTFLAECAARTVAGGGTVLAVDLHGDLGPAIVARLDRDGRRRVVAVDASERPVVGVAALRRADPRAAAHFVAAVKRLSPDGSEVYWGFRLERIFDAFVRLVQETGGSIDDLYALLTDGDRRDAARLATREPELARFLRELDPVVRRTPDFLWGAASRLAKIVLVPELRELLAPTGEEVPLEELFDAPGAVIVRAPFASLGPEAASFAASLIVARAYLGTAARRRPGGAHRPLTFVLDEVQGLSPRLVAEMLSEGRKFGVRLVIASQYPERLAPELRLAAAGVGRGVVVFRTPRAGAASAGGWVGLPPVEAERLLPDLPTGVGVARSPGTGDLRTVIAGAQPAEPDYAGWTELVDRTRANFPAGVPAPADDEAGVTERLLLAVLAAEESGTPARPEALLEAATRLPGSPIDPAALECRRPHLTRAGLVTEANGTLHLTPAGERRIGLHTTTGASRESAEHRALLVRAFRIFARHGCRMEIVRQGRYDTTLPDGRFLQVADAGRPLSPRALAAALEEAQRGWAWRCFQGLDVHVEAEVSGALRAARVRRGWEKARGRGAFALFLVGDARRAARVRTALRTLGAGPQSAQVWTLRGCGLLE